MPTDNKTLIEKADLGLADLLDGGGALAPTYAKTFIRTAITESNFLKKCTVKPMASYQERMPRIGLSQRVLRSGTPGTEVPIGDRVKPELGLATLDAKLFKGEVRIPDEVLEDNIEQGNLQNVVLQMIPEAVGRDLDEVTLQGDTASEDEFLAQFDGVIKQASSHLVDFGGARMNFDDLGDMRRKIPKNFRRYLDRYEFLTSYQAEDDYRKLLQQRETIGGDAAISAAEQVRFRGLPINAINMMPDELGGGTNETVALLCNPKDIVVGFWRNVRIEIDRNKREGAVYFIVTVRVDVKLTNPDAFVKGHSILNS